MNTLELLSHMRSLDVRVWAEGERLRYRGPAVALTPDLLAELSRQKQAVLEILAERNIGGRSSVLLRAQNRPRHIPLSFDQESQWLVHRLEPESPAYHIPFAIRLDGDFDRRAMAGSIDAAVRRHEILRTVFPEVDGGPVQAILPPRRGNLPQVDLSACPAGAGEREAERVAAEHARRPFDLTRGPAFRAALLRLGPESHVLLINLHHIAIDDWSINLLMREVAEVYQELRRGGAPSSAELPVQYADFAIWQREWLQGETMEKLQGYWQGRLAGCPEVVPLATDRPRPVLRSTRGGESRLLITPGRTAELERLSRQHGSTLFMTLLAAFKVLLLHHAETDDLVVGTPLGGRGQVELEQVLGLFVNVLAIRTDLSGRPSFLAALERVRSVMLEAYAHAELPFSKLVEAIRPRRDLGYNPLVQVLFALTREEGWASELPGLRAGIEKSSLGASTFDLSIILWQRESDVRGFFEYSADLFDECTAARITQRFIVLLESLVAEPERAVQDLSLMTVMERHQLLEEWNDTRCGATEGLVLDWVEAQARRAPHQVAMVAPGGRENVTYGELVGRSNQLARFLRRLGTGPEERVGVCCERSPELVVALCGVLRAGGIYVPLDPAHPAERLAWMLSDAQPRVLLTQEHLRDRLPGDAGRGRLVLALDGGWGELARESAAGLAPRIDPANLAYIIYTSGSSGRPKGVMVSHGALANFVDSTLSFAGLSPCDRSLQFASIGFDVSVKEILTTLSAGATLVLRDGAIVASFAEFAATCQAAGLTVVDLPVAFVHELAGSLESSKGAVWPPFVRRMMFGGERALPERTVALARSVGSGVRFINGYGPTETTVEATAHAFRGGAAATFDGRDLPIGRPVGNVRVYVVSLWDGLAAMGLPGELCIGGAGVARGYLGRPERTALSFVPDPWSGLPGSRLYRTGDRVRWRTDGELEFLGRFDSQIKIRGFRVELGEIESVLAEHPAVAEAVVVAHGSPPGSLRLAGYWVPCAGASASPAELRAFLLGRLPEYMVPAAYVELAALPLTRNDKVDRRALPAVEPGAFEVGVYVAPRTPTEQVVVGIWEELLGLERVSARANFFTLGGHSLLAIQLVSRLRAGFAVELTVRDIFDSATVAELGARIDEALQRGHRVAEPPITRVAREDGVELSFAQQRLWFLDQLAPGGASYNIPAGFRLKGPLDAGVFALALSEVARRHEALRTRFELREGRPVQTVTAPAPVPLPVIDLGGLAAVRQAAELQRRIDAEALGPFDLVRGPLWRTHLLRLAAEEHAVVLVLHHIVSDGWSMGLLVEEVGALYRAFAAGEPSPLAELPVQLGDYAAWQRQWLQGDVLETQLAYWRETLDGVPPLLEMPTDRPRPAMQSGRGAEVSIRLPEETGQAVAALARRLSASPFMVLLATFHLLLGRYAGSDDVVVGTPIAGRQRIETERLIGLFINLLALRARWTGRTTVRELVAQVRDRTLGAHVHQDLPFERLVEELRLPRDLAYEPLVQVVFSLDMRRPATVVPGWAVSPLAPAVYAAKFDLHLALEAEEERLSGALAYSRDLFDGPAMLRLLRHYEALLGEVLADPERPLATLGMLQPAERHQLLGEWNDTAMAFAGEACLHERFAAQAVRTPTAVALVCGEERISYGDLALRANRLARRLCRLGVGPESRVGIALRRSSNLVVALLAVLEAGGAYVPLDPAYPRERLAFILADAQAGQASPVLLSERHVLDRLPELAGTLLCLDEVDLTVEGAGVPPGAARRAAAGNLAYLIYTSGSTGRPKGVAITHRNAAALLDWAAPLFSAAELSGVLAATSITFDLSVFELFLPLTTGGTVLLADDALALPHLPAAGEVRLVNTVPSALAALVRTGGVPTGVRTVNLAGEVLPRSLVDEIYSLPGVEKVYNLYGPSEDTTYSTWVLVPRSEAREPAVGMPVGGSQASVTDRGLALQPAGVPGELCLGGEGVARGYLNRPELTAERFVPDPFAALPGRRLYRTGDLARRRADGQLEFIGRLDHQVKLRGFRIELGEVEAALGAHPEVAEAVVLLREDRLAAWVAPAVPADLRERLRERLPVYMIPAVFVPLPALPRTPNGKVDRRALPAVEPGAFEAGVYVAPRTPTEQVVVGIWEELLGLERVSARANFFTLGGHSLLAIQLVSRLRAGFAVELTVRDVFDSATVAELGARIDEALQRGHRVAEPPITRVAREDGVELSFAQQRLWFLDQLAPGGASYNIPAGFRLKGPLDAGVFALALSEVARRHEALRSRFALREGRPVQTVTAPAPVPLPVIDLGGLAAVRQTAELQRRIDAEALRPFDLVQGPLWRAHLLRLAVEEHAVVLVLHHIVSDGWSMGLLVEEVGALYRAFAAGEPSPLAELPVQLGDYADWQRQWLQGDVLETQLAYWRETLDGVPPLLEMPADRLRPAMQSGRGAEVSIRLPEETGQAVAALARRLSASPFMVLLATFHLLLGRYAGSDDVVVGTPIAGRQRIETERLIGLFINLLALRARWTGGTTVRELVAQVRDRTLGAHVHQDLPFERLVEELRLPRDLAYEPLVQVVFSLDMRRPVAAVPGWAVSPLAPAVYAAKFDLHLALESEEGRLSGALGYSRDLFEATSMLRLLRHYAALLGELVADPERPLALLGVLQPAERHQLLAEWNDGAAVFAMGRPVHELVAAVALASPEAIALVHASESLSYGELVARSRRLASLLQARGVGPEVAVAVCAERSLARVVGLLAVLLAGAAYVPLDPTLPAERLAFMLRDCAAPVVLTEERLAACLPADGAVPLLLDGGWEAAVGAAAGPVPVAVKASHLAYVIYTSGSTGRPKGVEVSHGSLLNLVGWHLAAHAVTAADRATQLAGSGFDAAVWELWPYLACGAAVHLAAPETLASPELLRDWLVASRITVSFLPTPLAEVLMALPWPATACLRRLLTGGDRLHAGPPAGLPFALFNHYGPTESTVVASWCAVAPSSGPGAAEGLPPIGRPVGNSELYVLDAGGGVLPRGAAGELFIGGAGVARGYRGAAAATAERFVPDPFARRPGSRLYRTGDRVRYRPDGNLEFLGRLDDQVKIRGFRIELGEIERTLADHPAVREAAVVVRETGGDRRLVAFWAAATEAAVGELRAFLRDRLPEYMVPAAFQRLPALPLTANGKVDRRALPAGEGDAAAAEAAGAAPRDLLELQLSQLWQEMLGVPAVSVRDSFFDLGGHSLLAVRLISAIERRYGRQLPLSALFQAPTVEALAAILRDQGGLAPASSLVPLRPGGPRPPLSLVHPVGGHVFAYLPLARRLGAERPLYGFQSWGALPGQAPDATIEEMAQRYLEELVAAQPAGPYHLAGWSMGGFVALEMACRLLTAGRQVGLLALLDTSLAVAGSAAPADEADLMTTFVLDRGLPEEQAEACAGELRRAAPADRLAGMRALLLRENLVPPDLELAALRQLFALFGANFAAARTYRPRFFAGRIDLFAARESLGAQPQPVAGWRKLAAEVAVHGVPGGHFSLLKEPHVGRVAERLESCLS